MPRFYDFFRALRIDLIDFFIRNLLICFERCFLLNNILNLRGIYIYVHTEPRMRTLCEQNSPISFGINKQSGQIDLENMFRMFKRNSSDAE